MARFLLGVLVVMVSVLLVLVFVLLVRIGGPDPNHAAGQPAQITIIQQLPMPATSPSTAASAPTSTQPTQTVTPAPAPSASSTVVPRPPAVITNQGDRQGAPATAEEVARVFGGSAAQWSHGPDEYGRTVGPNAWIFRSFGTRFLSFTVPDGCVVDTPSGRQYPGDLVQTTDLTIYWGAS